MKQNIGLIVLEHLSHQLNVQVLLLDFLEASVHDHDSFIEFFLSTLSESVISRIHSSYNIRNYPREQQTLLVLMWTFLRFVRCLRHHLQQHGMY